VKKILPPLNALRVFEAAARHSSFKRAGAELNITHSAVSHHIALLEDSLQIALFRRLNRQVILTEEGTALLADVAPALDQISLAVTTLTKNRGTVQLRVDTGPTFATRWLIPRLPSFLKANPNIDFRLRSSTSPVDFSSTDFEVAIRRKAQSRGGVQEAMFLPGMLVPICSPVLFKTLPTDPAEFEKHTLLHSFSMPLAWADWLSRMGVSGLPNARSLVFEEVGMTIEGAIAGAGIAIAPAYLVADELRSGKLILPMNHACQEGHQFRAFYTSMRGKKDAISRFLAWLGSQGAAAKGDGIGVELKPMAQ